jgi:hypothetical protein
MRMLMPVLFLAAFVVAQGTCRADCPPPDCLEISNSGSVPICSCGINTIYAGKTTSRWGVTYTGECDGQGCCVWTWHQYRVWIWSYTVPQGRCEKISVKICPPDGFTPPQCVGGSCDQMDCAYVLKYDVYYSVDCPD